MERWRNEEKMEIRNRVNNPREEWMRSRRWFCKTSNNTEEEMNERGGKKQSDSLGQSNLEKLLYPLI